MVHGLPIINHQTLMDFRSFVNTSLNQHVIVAAPLIPKWKSGIKQVIVKKGMEELFVIAITSSGQAAYSPITGGTYFSIGKVDMKDAIKGAVLLASFCKNESLLGGTFTIVDVFSYDTLNVLQMPYPQRFSFAKYVQTLLKFPSRYSIETAIKYDAREGFDAFGINE